VKRRLPALALAFFVSACASNAPTPASTSTSPAPAVTARRTHELLDAVLWTQTAVEHDALCRQSFLLARDRVERALSDPTWTALPEQTAGYERLPAAVVFDADETIIDNSAYETELVREDKGYDSPLFDEWAREPRAAAIPGAVEFTRFLKEKGVETIVIKNRDAPQKAATLKNLLDLGFVLNPDGSTLLLRGERKEWTDKASRRAVVARSYRVLLLLGDDLGDFVAGNDTTVEKRRELAARYDAYWGSKWIVLPNPMYGSW